MKLILTAGLLGVRKFRFSVRVSTPFPPGWEVGLAGISLCSLDYCLDVLIAKTSFKMSEQNESLD